LSNSSHFQTVFKHHKAGCIAARLRQTIDKAGADWIGDDHEHDRHCVSRPKDRSCRKAARGHNDVRRERDQIFGLSAADSSIAPSEAVVDPHVTALAPAQLL
jgi:hypothetical protein